MTNIHHDLKISSVWKISNSQYSPSLTSDIERSYAIYAIKSKCYTYNIIDGFMAWQKVQPSISHCKYIQRSFHHDFINNKDIIIKISESMNHEWVAKLRDFCADAVIAHNVGNTVGYLHIILNFRCHFRRKFRMEIKTSSVQNFRNTQYSFNLTPNMQRSYENFPPKVFFMIVTSLWCNLIE